MVQSDAERYNATVQIRIGFHGNEPPTAQSLRPSVRTGAPPFTQGRHEALPRQYEKQSFLTVTDSYSGRYIYWGQYEFARAGSFA